MFISLDLETTGFDPVKDKIIEFGAVKFGLSDKKEKLKLLFNPGTSLPQIITFITGIKDQDLKDAPPFQSAKETIKNFIGELPIIGHNIAFDIGFLRENGIEITNPLYDTKELAEILLPDLPSYSLEILSHKLNLKHEEKHRALDDAIAAMELFQKLIRTFQNLDPKLIDEIKELCQKSDWHLKDLIAKLKPAKLSGQKSKSQSGSSRSDQQSTPQASNFYKTILKAGSSTLFKALPPFNDLTKNLAANIDNNAAISVPGELFREIYGDLPDSLIKLDLAKNYISLKRFSELKGKNHFENYELVSVLKYLIWLNKSKSQLLSEVRLSGEERKIIEKINADDLSIPAEKSSRSQIASPIICTHEYLIQKLLDKKSLVIVDFEDFLNSLAMQNSGYTKLDYLLNSLHNLLEIEPENSTLKSLSSKSTILFGLLGIIFEKAKKQKSTAIITEEIIYSAEWQKLTDAVNSLIEISKQLIEIKNAQTEPFLLHWKEKLKTLDFIIRQTDLDNYLTFIDLDHTQALILRKIPASTKEPLQKILQKYEKYQLISETTDTNILELPEGIKINEELAKKDSAKITISAVSGLNENDKNEIPNFFKNYLKEIAKTNEEKIAIVCNSKQQLEFLSLKLQEAELKIVSQLTGSIGKIEEQFLHSKEAVTLLLTAYNFEHFQYGNKIDVLFILKIPFDAPSNAKLLARSLTTQDPFNEIQIPQAVLKLEKFINRIHNTENSSGKHIVILDERLSTKSYGNIFMQKLEQIGKVQHIKLADLCV